MKKKYRLLNIISMTILPLLISVSAFAQSEMKTRAEKNFRLLNFQSQLNNYVSIDNSGVKIFSSPTQKKSGSPEFTLYWTEVPAFGKLAKSLDQDTLIKLYQTKKNSDFTAVWGKTKPIETSVLTNNSLPLAGKKIALDPGHVAGNLECGKIEQKFLDWAANDSTGLPEAVQLAEGMLTWQTAMLLKQDLEKKGAVVFITRPSIQSTSFGLSYDEWLTKRKKIVLDSLLTIKKLSTVEYKSLLKADKKSFFWNFFRDYDLANRARIINASNADLALIIHYNVDEKNKDWKKPSDKNFSMCFIGGAMTADNFIKPINKLNFLRLLVTEDLTKSEQLSSLLVNEFAERLNTRIAGLNDAVYLKENCVAAESKGVFCRNLALCRNIQIPLAYGESLYQDHIEECLRLTKNDKNYDGIKTNERVKQVADCYSNAVMKYFAH